MKPISMLLSMMSTFSNSMLTFDSFRMFSLYKNEFKNEPPPGVITFLSSIEVVEETISRFFCMALSIFFKKPMFNFLGGSLSF